MFELIEQMTGESYPELSVLHYHGKKKYDCKTFIACYYYHWDNMQSVPGKAEN